MSSECVADSISSGSGGLSLCSFLLAASTTTPAMTLENLRAHTVPRGRDNIHLNFGTRKASHSGSVHFNSKNGSIMEATVFLLLKNTRSSRNGKDLSNQAF